MTRAALEIEVTDSSGRPVAGVDTRAAGPVERDGVTDENGALRLTNVRAGSYRLHFEHQGFITLERDVTLPQASRTLRVDVKLTPAPQPAAPAPPPAAPAAKPEPPRPVGEAKAVQVAAFAEKNFIGRGEPQKLSVIGCTGYATSRLLQLRDPIENRVNENADETFYLVAGEVTVRVAGNDRALDLGTLFVIPRGMPYTLTRRGRNPAILVSVLSGPPCYEDKGQPH